MRLTLEAAKRAKCSHHFEVIVVGDTKVGKTSMLKKFLRTDLEAKDDIIRSTVTPDDIGWRVFKYRDKHVKLKLWDMPGICSCFNVVNESILEAADGAILLFDVTNEQSFVNLVSDENNSRQIKRSWMKELRFKAKGDKHPVVILVGNKIDRAERNVSKSVMEELLPSQSDMSYCEISAKENIGIEEMFESFIVSLMKKASKDKRYGVMRNDDHHSHENIPSHDEHRHRMRETYPPGTIVRNQPTSQYHATEGRVDLDPNSSPQSRRSTGSSNFCC